MSKLASLNGEVILVLVYYSISKELVSGWDNPREVEYGNGIFQALTGIMLA